MKAQLHKELVGIFACVFLAAAPVRAHGPEHAAPTPKNSGGKVSSLSYAGATADQCVAEAVATARATCAAGDPSATPQLVATPDSLASSAKEIADRLFAKCLSKPTKAACSVCAKVAQAQMVARFDKPAFHGELARAKFILERYRRGLCGTLSGAP